MNKIKGGGQLFVPEGAEHLNPPLTEYYVPKRIRLIE